jgi:hypothetical protein
MVIGKKAVRTRVLKDDELRLMWNAADAMGYPYGPLFRLLALTGQRKSEVAEARWSEFDLEGSPGCSTSGKVFDSNAGPLLRNGLLRPLPVYHGFSTATLEDRLVAMFRDHLWPDDLDRLYGAIEGERDVLAGDVFEAANEAIVRGMMTHVKMQRQLTQNRRSQIISRPLNGLPREQAFPWRS